MSTPRQALPDLWHYTCGIKIPLILESGYLLPIPTNYARTPGDLAESPPCIRAHRSQGIHERSNRDGANTHHAGNP